MPSSVQENFCYPFLIFKGGLSSQDNVMLAIQQIQDVNFECIYNFIQSVSLFILFCILGHLD